MMITVTIGIIARNEGKNIHNTLENVLNQSFDHGSYEIIVVDGNSDDDTREIAAEILNTSPVKHNVLNEADFGFHGHCFARNLVIDHSDPNSKYIAFTDADCEVDKDWLLTLYNAIKNTDDNIAGAGGPRLIAETSNKKELVINAVITSLIASGGNPAFTPRNIKYIKSIPNYNAIYKGEIISNYRYDEKLIMSDDNELNYRLRSSGYNFINVPQAKVWHHETNSIIEFAMNMFSYGVNITNTIKKHKRMININVPITITFIFYLLLLIPIYYLLTPLILIPILLYIIFALLVFIEVFLKTRSIYSLLVFILLPVQHIFYGLGAILNLIMPKKN